MGVTWALTADELEACMLGPRVLLTVEQYYIQRLLYTRLVVVGNCLCAAPETTNLLLPHTQIHLHHII
jgi:hypothetical protein